MCDVSLMVPDSPPRESAPPVPGAEHDRRVAILWLTATTVCWGATFPLMQLGMKGLGAAIGPTADPVNVSAIYLFWRFLLAGLLFPILFPASVRAIRADTFRAGLLLAIPVVIGFVLQLTGLQGTTPAISAFLTSTYVVFTPLLAWLVWRRVPSAGLAVGLLLIVGGLGFWVAGGEAAGFRPGLSEALTLACAVSFAVQILATDRLTRRHPPDSLTAILFPAIALAGLAVALATGPSTPFDRPVLRALWEDDWLFWSLVLNAVFGSIVALWAMNRYQKFVPPTRAAMLYTCEPVCAAGFSMWLVHEQFPLMKIVGAGFIVWGNLFTEWWSGRRDRAAASAGEDG